MVRGETLAKSAGVKGVYVFIDHTCDAFIAMCEDLSGHITELEDIFLIGEDFDLDFVEDVRISFVEHCVKDTSDMFDFEACFCSVYADADPYSVSLTHMPETLSLVHKGVNLSFEDGLKIDLHFSACDLDDDGEGQFTAWFNGVNVGAFDINPAVFDFGGIEHTKPFEGRSSLTAKLDVHILFTNAFAFESRAEGDRDRDTCDFYFEASNFDGFFNDLVVRDI